MESLRPCKISSGGVDSAKAAAKPFSARPVAEIPSPPPGVSAYQDVMIGSASTKLMRPSLLVSRSGLSTSPGRNPRNIRTKMWARSPTWPLVGAGNGGGIKFAIRCEAREIGLTNSSVLRLCDFGRAFYDRCHQDDCFHIRFCRAHSQCDGCSFAPAYQADRQTSELKSDSARTPEPPVHRPQGLHHPACRIYCDQQWSPR